MNTPKKNRYKVQRGRRQVFVIAQNLGEAEKLGREVLSIPSAVIKISYCGHA